MEFPQRIQTLKRHLKKADFLVLDGVYFAFSSILLQGKIIKRNQGPDVFNYFIKRLNEQSGKAFFGFIRKYTEQDFQRANNEFPNISNRIFSLYIKMNFQIIEKR